MKLYDIPTLGVLALLGVAAFASSLWIEGQSLSQDSPDLPVSAKLEKRTPPFVETVKDHLVQQPAPKKVTEVTRPFWKPIIARYFSGDDCSTAGDQNMDWWPRVPEIAECIRAKHGNSLRTAAQRNGVPEAVIVAIIIKESEGDPKKVSSTGCCVGLMQIDKGATARQFGINPEQLFEPHVNILGGAKVLGDYSRRSGSLETGLMWYFAGPSGTSDKSQDYVARVKRILAVI